MNNELQLKNKKVRILGAGISGLVAGITLARNGFQVEIFEKRPRIGSFFEKTIHSLRNYYYDYDVIRKYRSLGIKISNIYPIFREFRFSPSLKKVEIYSKNKPLFYNFVRGYNSKKSFDFKLYETAKKLGVKLYFNKVINHKEVDIIATGASSIGGIAYGEHYSEISGLAPNSVYIFLDNRYSPNGYSCILPFNNEASIFISSTKNESKDDLKKKFNLLKNNNPIIRKIIKNAKFKNEIFGFAFFDDPKTAIKNGKLYVGESAGFLDAATGFGTHYAILSGYLAAIAIIENKNYDDLWKETFEEEIKIHYLKRGKIQKFTNRDHEKIIDILTKKYGGKLSASEYKLFKLPLNQF
ncbi:MAG: NAD(P)/FAD-dependent oxidoreductase [Candidatus Aenigmarchaeota archaeon]|nr:NAD(P)/FAD-dependent oxidoreductase [Candidatus Aenigmarchaeota archaeon]